MAVNVAFPALSAAMILLMGGAVLLSYRATSFLDVSLGGTFVAGGIAFHLIYSQLDIPAIPAAAIAAAVSGTLSVLLHVGLYDPLRRRGAM